jgi:hypothetical protein
VASRSKASVPGGSSGALMERSPVPDGGFYESKKPPARIPSAQAAMDFRVP